MNVNDNEKDTKVEKEIPADVAKWAQALSEESNTDALEAFPQGFDEMSVGTASFFSEKKKCGGKKLGLETRYPNDKERDCRCAGCNTILICELVASTGQDTYAFMKKAVAKTTVTTSFEVGVGVGSTGPTAGVGAGRSVTIEKGEWLITYLLNDGNRLMCTDCFRVAFPIDFKGILLSTVGKAKVINSQFKWYTMSYGTT